MDFFNIKEIILKYTKNKKVVIIALAFVVGFILLIMPTKVKNEKSEQYVEQKDNINVLYEKRLKDILTAVDGVKKVEIMICFNDDGVKEYYKDESEDVNEKNVRTDKKMVITRNDGNEVPVLKRELSPDIKGVSIVADCNKKGMEDLIYTLTSKALGVEVYKIEVVINDRSR